MKLPITVLREYVQTKLSAEQIGDLLTMAGFELEDLETIEGEAVLDIKVMANRGDGLSAFGLAREIIVKDPGATPTPLYQSAVNRFAEEKEPNSLGFAIKVETDACTRFACMAFEDVENGESPDWLKKRLEHAGSRPISLLVDLTNYVMLELGQPLHAYDRDLLEGDQIIVRQAKKGEKLTTLNGTEHTLSEQHMVICDAKRPIGVAGVMGGENTEVSSSTKRMILESAHFRNMSVRKTRKELGLSTDASYRFERSVDPMGVTAALYRFRDLYRSITGKTNVPGITEIERGNIEVNKVLFRPSRARKLLGIDEISDDRCRQILVDLGFEIEPSDAGWVVTSPSWRPDVTLEEDIVEEIGRVYGYDQIPEKLPEGATPRGGVFGLFGVIDTAKKTMLRCGLDQMWSHTLRDHSPLDFNPARNVLVRNPHSPEMALLRNSLLPGLAEAAVRNGAKDIRIFEIGKVFVKGDYEIDESPELAILMTGNVREPHWAQKAVTKCDFWTIKGIIEELGKLLKDGVTFDLPRLPDHRFHPTRQAGILVDQGRLWVGTVGQLHPDVTEKLGLPVETYAAELDLLVFFQNPDSSVECKPISRNPAVRRDIAFTISKSVPYRKIESAIENVCGSVLEQQKLFDVYEGKGIPEGSHSLAITLQLRKLGENYTDEEANEVRDRVVEAISALGGVLRQ